MIDNSVFNTGLDRLPEDVHDDTYMYKCPSSGRFCARLPGLPWPVRNFHLFQKTKVGFIYFIRTCNYDWFN